MSRPRFDPKSVAARARGLAPPAISRNMRPGAVFEADDSAIRFPEEGLGGQRTIHMFRRVVIVQDASTLRTEQPKSVLVVPCSASKRAAADPWDFEIPGGEGGFTAAHVVAYVSLVQPILKSSLVSFCGDVSAATLLKIQGVLARNLGIYAAMEITLPPRDSGVHEVATGRQPTKSDVPPAV